MTQLFSEGKPMICNGDGKICSILLNVVFVSEIVFYLLSKR
jgi:hypothetical protein